MKYLATISFIFGCVLSYGQKTTSKYTGMDYDSLMKARQEQAVGKPFASFSALCKNNVFTNDSLKGKVVFVNLWFAACPPCMAEMGGLNELYDSLKTKNNFEFISFTYDPPEIIDSVVKLYNISYKVLRVTQQDCYRLNLNNGFPASLIVNGKGTIKYLNVGGYSDAEKVRQSVFDLYYSRLLNEIKEAPLN